MTTEPTTAPDLSRDIAFHARMASTLEGAEVAVGRLLSPLQARIAELEAGLTWALDTLYFEVRGHYVDHMDKYRSLLAPAQEEPNKPTSKRTWSTPAERLAEYTAPAQEEPHG